ncbi:FMRFamide receptor-like [Mizuhopecten yessoensis]|uniref:FMRFamide receptor n=1 Tax=Mizuhopecten yessoensis TaxID=6573 RepID=A0A210QL12_MIZYE|nr:FMRFamide receptor-like [Mizuhopecten yessoensis]OWF49396.1 FMRFamide receptor [Mizuhopecten yessoensis]
MFTTESSIAFAGNENSTTNSTNVFGNYENSTTVSTEAGSSRSNYYVIDQSVMDIFKKILVCGIIPPMSAFGIVGNILALLILIRRKPINSTTVVLIAIAIADLAFIATTIVNVVSLLIRIYYPENAKEVTMKIIIPFSVYLSPLPGRISNWLVALVSLERLIAVTRPFKVKQICTKKLMIVLSIVLPLSVAILTSPKLWLYEVKDVTLPDGNVTKIIALGFIGRQKQLFEVYYLVSETLLRFVPMGVIIVSNAVIICVTCIQAKWRRHKQNYVIGKPSTDERQITKTLLTITCIFIVCLLPSTISRLMVLFDANSTYYKYSSNVPSLLNFIGLLTETTNSSINFVIYVTMNSAYRRQLYLICGKRFKTKAISNTVFNSVAGSATSVHKGQNSHINLSTTDLSTVESSGDIHM